MTLHWQPLALVSGLAVGTAAGVFAARAARSAALQPGSDAIRRTSTPSAEWGIPIVGAAAGVAMGARFGVGVELAAYLLLVAVALPLSAIDIAVRKVPDRILMPAMPAGVALLALSAHSAGAYGALWRALLAAVATFAGYLALALATGQVGLGDCKAAGLCGIYLGFLGAQPAVLGVVAAFVLAACYALGRRAVGAEDDTRTLAFAPFIFAGAIIAIIAS